MNWKALPWRKLLLLCGAGAAAALGGAIPESAMMFGVSLQHIALVVAGALGGWAKRAPGDVKALPLPPP